MAPVHNALKCFKTVRYLILQCTFEKQMSLLPLCYRGETGTEIFRVSIRWDMYSDRARGIWKFLGERVSCWSPFLQEWWPLPLWILKIKTTALLLMLLLLLLLLLWLRLRLLLLLYQVVAGDYKHPKDFTDQQIGKSWLIRLWLDKVTYTTGYIQFLEAKDREGAVRPCRGCIGSGFCAPCATGQT